MVEKIGINFQVAKVLLEAKADPFAQDLAGGMGKVESCTVGRNQDSLKIYADIIAM